VHESAGDHIFLYEKGVEVNDGWVFFMYIRVLVVKRVMFVYNMMPIQDISTY
jgi:hypothetical protein